MLKTGYEDYPQYNAILGMDEVGYGCGAGDLYVAGVILPKEYSNSELKDSKKITSEKKRKRISDDLLKSNIIYCIKSVSVDYINEFGISQALKIAFQSVANELSGKYDAVFIDGIETRGLNVDADIITVVKGDNTFQNIAAASIIAKVHRDEYMVKMNDKYPGYDLASNKGYLTKNHLLGLKENGQIEIHRKQYVKNHI